MAIAIDGNVRSGRIATSICPGDVELAVARQPNRTNNTPQPTPD